MNSNFFIGAILAITLGAMMYAMGYMMSETQSRMEEQQGVHELTAIINGY